MSTDQYNALALTPSTYYRNRMSCSVVVTSPPGSTILMSFGNFDTEASCDFLTLYSGFSTAAPLIDRYSGAHLLDSEVESTSTSA